MLTNSTLNPKTYQKLLANNVESNNFKYNENIIFKYNNFFDMQYFWTVMVCCSFVQYSKNQLPNFDAEKLWEKRRRKYRLKCDQNRFHNPTISSEYSFFELEAGKNYHPLIFNSSVGCVDIFFTKFNNYIMNDLFMNHGYSPEADGSDTPEETQRYLIQEFIAFLANYRNETIYNLPTTQFYEYMRQRTIYQSSFAVNYYENYPEMMSIELSVFFPYKEDLIDLIECLKLTANNFKEKGALAFDEENWIFAKESYKFRTNENNLLTFNKLIDYYLSTLLENLSYQATLLPSIKNIY
jgi:hypothetical protein